MQFVLTKDAMEPAPGSRSSRMGRSLVGKARAPALRKRRGVSVRRIVERVVFDCVREVRLLLEV